MHTNYEVTVEFATPPLKRTEKYLVETKEDIELIRVAGKREKDPFTVVAYHIRNVRRADEVVRELDREFLETRRAMKEWEPVL